MLQVLLFSFLLLERDMLCTELLAVGADVEKYADEQSVEAELVLAGGAVAEAEAASVAATVAAAAPAALAAATLVLLMLPVAIAVTVEMAQRVAFSIEEAVWE